MLESAKCGQSTQKENKTLNMNHSILNLLLIYIYLIIHLMPDDLGDFSPLIRLLYNAVILTNE